MIILVYFELVRNGHVLILLALKAIMIIHLLFKSQLSLFLILHWRRRLKNFIASVCSVFVVHMTIKRTMNRYVIVLWKNTKLVRS